MNPSNIDNQITDPNDDISSVTDTKLKSKKEDKNINPSVASSSATPRRESIDDPHVDENDNTTSLPIDNGIKDNNTNNTVPQPNDSPISVSSSDSDSTVSPSSKPDITRAQTWAFLLDDNLETPSVSNNNDNNNDTEINTPNNQDNNNDTQLNNKDTPIAGMEFTLPDTDNHMDENTAPEQTISPEQPTEISPEQPTEIIPASTTTPIDPSISTDAEPINPSIVSSTNNPTGSLPVSRLPPVHPVSSSSSTPSVVTPPVAVTPPVEPPQSSTSIPVSSNSTDSGATNTATRRRSSITDLPALVSINRLEQLRLRQRPKK